MYGGEHTFRAADVAIKHNVNAQKTKGYTRYQVDQGAQLHLSEELRKGHVQVSVEIILLFFELNLNVHYYYL